MAPLVQHDLGDLPDRAAAFTRRWRWRIRWASASDWARACREAEEVLTPLADVEAALEVVRAAGADVGDVDVAGVEAGSLESARVSADAMMNVFESAWLALRQRQKRRFLADPALADAGPFLRRLRPQAEVESRPEVSAAVDAWLGTFERTTSSALVLLDERLVTLQEGARRLESVDPGVRRAAGEAMTAALAGEAESVARAYLGLVQTAAASGRRTGRTGWLDERHIANGTTEEEVAALVAAVTADDAFVAGVYQLKGLLVGRMTAWDRNAPVAASLGLRARTYSWDEAVHLVVDAFAAFSPEVGAAAAACLSGGFVDATDRPAKRGGAFTIPAASGRWAFVSVPFGERSGTLDDVALLAHELGHAAHATLSHGHGLFSCLPSVPVAETAALFCEQLLVEHLLAAAASDAERLALLLWRCEWTVTSVHRQVAIHRFEAGIHESAWAGASLTPADVAERFLASQTELYGGSVELPDGFRHWWMQVGHLFRSPGYVHSYGYGGLAALAAVAEWRDDPDAAARRSIELLAAGGTVEMADLGDGSGGNGQAYADAGWRRGLAVAGDALREAEAMVTRRSVV